MSDYTRVYFEGLGIDFDVPSVAFTIGSYSIHWYGIILLSVLHLLFSTAAEWLINGK